MATSSQMAEEDMAKEVLVYHAFVEFVKALEAIRSGYSSKIMSTSYNQGHNSLSFGVYLTGRLGKNNINAIAEYVSQKYYDNLKTWKKFDSVEETVIPGTLYNYRFYTKTENDSKMKSTLQYHE